MIILVISYKGEPIAKLQAFALPSVGEQIMFEGVMYNVIGRCFSYEGGMTVVAVTVDKISQ